MKLRTALLGGVLLLSLATEALCDGDTWILASGRRDPRMYAIHLEKALRPENNNTVTGVGNDPYGLAVVDLKGRDRDDD
jgi:hypothetical protein